MTPATTQYARRYRPPKGGEAPLSHLADAEARAEFMAHGYETSIEEPIVLLYLPREAQQLCLWVRPCRPVERIEYANLLRSGDAIEAGTYRMRDTFTPFAEFERNVLDDLAATRDTLQ